MHLTKQQVEDVIKYLDIVDESMDYVIRTQVAAADKLEKQRGDMVAMKDALESYIKKLWLIHAFPIVPTDERC